MLTFRGFGQILKSRKDAEVRRQREGKRVETSYREKTKCIC